MSSGLGGRSMRDIAFDESGTAWIATFMGVSEFEPAGPMNPLRECLTLQSHSAAYHPLFNGLVWRAGCP